MACASAFRPVCAANSSKRCTRSRSLRHQPALQLSPEGFVDLMIQFIVFRRFGHAAPLAGTRKGRLFAPLKSNSVMSASMSQALVFHRFLPICCCLLYRQASKEETAKGSWAECLLFRLLTYMKNFVCRLLHFWRIVYILVADPRQGLWLKVDARRGQSDP